VSYVKRQVVVSRLIVNIVSFGIGNQVVKIIDKERKQTIEHIYLTIWSDKISFSVNIYVICKILV